MARTRAKDKRGSTGPVGRSGLLGRLRSALGTFLFGGVVDDATADRLREIKGLLLIGFSLWLLVSVSSFYMPYDNPGAEGYNWGGQAGHYLARVFFLTSGLGGFLVVALGLLWGAVMVGGRAVSWVWLRFLGGVLFVLSCSFLLQLLFGPDDLDPHRGVGSRMPYGPGGYVALRVTPLLAEKFGGIGLLLLLAMVALVSFLLATERAFYPAWQGFRAWLAARRQERGESLLAAIGHWGGGLANGLWNFVRGAGLREELQPAVEGASLAALPAPAPVAEQRLLEELASDVEDEPGHEDADEPRAEEEDEEPEEEEEAEREVVPAAASGRKRQPKARPSSVPEPPTPPPGPWTFPPLDLLNRPDAVAGGGERFIEECAAKLEGALRSFRVEAQVVGAQVGPAVTLFELTVAQGTRLNKVTQLSGEIAAALRAQSVRIIAPIPGKDTIGIEVPNDRRRVVRIGELITQRAYDPRHMALPLFIGMDTQGAPIVEDLARMPHLLLAGTTGSGKSVCINTVLASLLLTRSPHDVKMILIDPKMVELQMFANVPHLMCPVVTDVKMATAVLLWAIEKMEGRYELFKSAGVKNIKGYNALSEAELEERLGEDWDAERTPRHLPYIVLVIDEMADLMMSSKKEAEMAITRLAQKSRAVGIHVIVATQRPSTDVITGVLKGNLPTRIAFQVASKIDSRVILDHSGAEKLLGGGDMLYTPPQSSQIKRVQGALVEDAELQKIVGFVCNNSAPSFSQELVQVASGERRPDSEAGPSPGDDPLWDEAVRVILKSKRGSASLLQRALGIGYTRASRLIDMMTEAGIVGPYKGSKVREIMMTLEQWEEAHGARDEDVARQGADDE